MHSLTHWLAEVAAAVTRVVFVPAGQLVQLDEPLVEEYVAAGQFVHLELPEDENVPAGQDVHVAELLAARTAENLPSGH